MKRDINFIRHTGKQVKEKERTDKADARSQRYERNCRMLGIPQQTVDIVEYVGLVKAIRSWLDAKRNVP